mmetsp:Transcript_60681/g.130299  ORF Transcript_60681/g.130299 Transcript_60681/m.130299 type:complete len:427 (+) Transcript_60681:80-1360(+)
MSAPIADPACSMEMCNGFMSCYGGSCWGGEQEGTTFEAVSYQYVGEGAGSFEMAEVPDSPSPSNEIRQEGLQVGTLSRNLALCIGMGLTLLFTACVLVGRSAAPAPHTHGQSDSVLRGASPGGAQQTDAESVEHRPSLCAVPELPDHPAWQAWCCSHFKTGCGATVPPAPPEASAGFLPLPSAAETPTAVADEHEVVTATTPTTTAPRAWPYPSLFCWLVMQAHTQEAELVRRQVQRKVGVFACDEHIVFSDYEAQVGEPTILLGDISVAQGAWGSAMNTEPFLRAWERLIQDGRFRRHDFIVKVDPDTVFIPARLKQHLGGVPASDTCYFKTQGSYPGFLGALEIVSRSAVEELGRRKMECTRNNQAANSGEDGFLQHCFNVLGIASRDDYGLLTSGPDCTRGTSAFHPFKDPDAFVRCLDTANR